LVCAAFFTAGSQPAGCTKQLTEVDVCLAEILALKKLEIGAGIHRLRAVLAATAAGGGKAGCSTEGR
jgi:hypothetical protein